MEVDLGHVPAALHFQDDASAEPLLVTPPQMPAYCPVPVAPVTLYILSRPSCLARMATVFSPATVLKLKLLFVIRTCSPFAKALATERTPPMLAVTLPAEPASNLARYQP